MDPQSAQTKWSVWAEALGLEIYNSLEEIQGLANFGGFPVYQELSDTGPGNLVHQRTYTVTFDSWLKQSDRSNFTIVGRLAEGGPRTESALPA